MAPTRQRPEHVFGLGSVDRFPEGSTVEIDDGVSPDDEVIASVIGTSVGPVAVGDGPRFGLGQAGDEVGREFLFQGSLIDRGGPHRGLDPDRLEQFQPPR